MTQWPSQKTKPLCRLVFSWTFLFPLLHVLVTHPFVSILFIMLCHFVFLPADSHSGERWGSNIQPQPGRQHQQIPRYHLSHSQGKTLEPAERCSSAPGRQQSRSELWLSNEGFYSGADNNYTHLSLTLSFILPLFLILSLICLVSMCPLLLPASVCLSLKPPLQGLFVALLFLTLPRPLVPLQSPMVTTAHYIFFFF